MTMLVSREMLEPRHNQTQGRNEEQLHVMDDGLS